METEMEGELLTPEEFYKDSGWQTVAVRRSGAKSAPIERVGGISTGAKPNDNLSAKGRRDRGRAKAKIIRGGRMPPLPKEDAKIIDRPIGGLNISKVGPIVVAEAIWNAVGIDPAKRDSDTMCPNFQQNNMVVSTPCRENATRYVRVECIAVGGQQLDLQIQEPLSVGYPWAFQSLYRERSRRRSRRHSGSRSVSRARSGSSVGQQMKRKSTLSRADRFRSSGETGPSRGPRDPLPEPSRDAEIARLQKENADLKEMVRKMASGMTEIKKLVISQSALVKASAPTAIEVLVPVSDSAGASKRRAVSSKEESVSQTNEINGMLATLTTSVQQLHQGLAQVQVALGDSKRGLGALADRIDALERLVIPKRLGEQMRLEMEALGLAQQEEAAEQAGSVSAHSKPSSAKSSVSQKGSFSTHSKASSAKSSTSPKRTPQASVKGSKTPSGEAEAKPEEAVKTQPEGESAGTEGAGEQGPEEGAAEKEEFDMFPEHGEMQPAGQLEPEKEAEPEEAQRLLLAVLIVLAALVLIVLAGLFLYAKPLEVLTNGTILKISPCSSPGCIKAKTLSDGMLQSANVKQGSLHPCNRFYEYSCGGWAARNIETSSRTALNEVLVNKMNHTLSTANLGTSEFEPYRNLVLFYRSCIDFHTTAMPTDVRVRKTLYLLDLSFSEWLHHNQDPIILFYFMIRLSLSQGINTLLKLSVIEKNREARVVLEVGMSAWQKFSSETSRKFDERTYRLYMSDALFSLGIPNITDKVIEETLKWDNVTTIRHKMAKADLIHEHTVYELLKKESKVSGPDWLYAINDNMPHTLRLKNTSHMDTHNLIFIEQVVEEFFSKSKIELVTYVVTLAMAELLRYDFNREHRYVATCLKSSYDNFPEPLMSLFVSQHLKKSVIDNFRIFFENIKREVVRTISIKHGNDPARPV
ncbi:hypothetical protein HPB49_013520 [Dermacentor silvarum]|uniref:Uncharacterized protein n=1 Tax=Dermacentor silvarum TaxID=543639 RepID=A0ACB8C3Y6_DERSI|nr:hypothetical protein HPB49_013520 [Dermacentor silvarum]